MSLCHFKMKIDSLILCMCFLQTEASFSFGNGNDNDVKVEPINNSMVLVYYANAIDKKNVEKLNEVWLLDSQDKELAKALRLKVERLFYCRRSGLGSD